MKLYLSHYSYFLLIIITLYVGYNYYCTIYEGQDSGAFGDYNTANDASNAANNAATSGQTNSPDYCATHNKPSITSYQDAEQTTTSYPCQYANHSCTSMFASVPGSKWEYGGGGNASEEQIRKHCINCVIGSNMDGDTRQRLAQIGYDYNKTSHFASQLCDGIVAGCSNPFWFANNHSDWTHYDCKKCCGGGVCSGCSLTENLLCTILTSSVLQFFMSFFGGVECELKIEADKMMQSVSDEVDKVEKDLDPL